MTTAVSDGATTTTMSDAAAWAVIDGVAITIYDIIIMIITTAADA